MKKLFEILKQEMQAKRDVTIVSVTASSGSTPRGSGARMIVGSYGRLYGTIGGGAVEYQCEQRAKEVLNTKISRTESYMLRKNEVQDLGMICGGDVECFFQYISYEDSKVKQLVDVGLRLFEKNSDIWLVTEITEGEKSQLGLYNEEVGAVGMDMDEDILSKMSVNPVKVNVENRTYYIEKINQNAKVYIFGGGHVAQQLVPTLARVNFSCVVVEDREEFARKELFEGVLDTVLIDMSNLDKIAKEITANDYVCIMTRGHQNDYEVQKQILKTDARYIGVIGSKRKIAGVMARLKDDGYNDKDLERITTPIGLAILAETPAEIAVSIAGQLIYERAMTK